MGDPASRYATIGVALRSLETLKSPHPDLPFHCQGGGWGLHLVGYMKYASSDAQFHER